MSAVVIDCSVAVSWCFEDEASEAGDALLDHLGEHGAVVPSLWHLEMGNVLLQAAKRGRIRADEADAKLRLMAACPWRHSTGNWPRPPAEETFNSSSDT